MNQDISPLELRHRIRSGAFTSNTSGYSRGYVQGNLCILPADYAGEFLQFCQSNPKPCPLIGMATSPGDYYIPKLGADLDLRTDVPSYRVFENGELVDEVHEIGDLWRSDLVSFVLGCSFSFEEALIDDGLEIRNVTEGVNVPMYRTDIDCSPAGRFASASTTGAGAPRRSSRSTAPGRSPSFLHPSCVPRATAAPASPGWRALPRC